MGLHNSKGDAVKVVCLSDHQRSPHAALLEWLLQQDREGLLDGMALCFRVAGSQEEARFTGDYRAEPGRAVNTAMRLSWKLTQLQDGVLP